MIECFLPLFVRTLNPFSVSSPTPTHTHMHLFLYIQTLTYTHKLTHRHRNTSVRARAHTHTYPFSTGNEKREKDMQGYTQSKHSGLVHLQLHGENPTKNTKQLFIYIYILYICTEITLETPTLKTMIKYY